MAEKPRIDKTTAQALGFESLDREAVARRLAQIGGLRTPTRTETQEFLMEVLVKALRQIPSSGAAWSWGEFHNGGTQPLYDMSRHPERWAVYAADLGLAEGAPVAMADCSPDGLARAVSQAIEHLLGTLRKELEQAGVSPYGPGHPLA